MRILVTGVAGFIGMALGQALLARGDAVIGVDDLNHYYDPQLKRDRLAELERAGGERFTFHELDFSDQAALEAALAGEEFDRIAHLGAQAGVRYSINQPHAYARSNLVGHLNLLEVARRRGVAHMVYASSSSVYGGNTQLPFSVDDRVDQPLSLYAATKRADELMSESYAHLYRLPLTGLRFFTVYGPWGRPDMAIWLFTQAILEGRPITLFNGGEMRRDFTYIDDIISGVVAALDRAPADTGEAHAGESRSPHAIYNLGNNRPERISHMVDLVETACGRRAIRLHQSMQPGDVPVTFADIAPVRRELGFEPRVTLEEGVLGFVEWFRRYRAP